MRPRSAGRRISFTKFSSAFPLYSSPRRIWSWNRRPSSTTKASPTTTVATARRGLNSFCAAPGALGGMSDISAEQARLLPVEQRVDAPESREHERREEARQDGLGEDPREEDRARGGLGRGGVAGEEERPEREEEGADPGERGEAGPAPHVERGGGPAHREEQRHREERHEPLRRAAHEVHHVPHPGRRDGPVHVAA